MSNEFFIEKKILFNPRQVLNQLTKTKETIRGLHYAFDPHAESKMIIPGLEKCFGFRVDLRRNSKTFGKTFSAILEPFKFSLFATRGFAHGCMSLTDNVNLTIIADNVFSDEHSWGYNLERLRFKD